MTRRSRRSTRRSIRALGDPEAVEIARVLRRLTFGPFPGQVESLLGLGPDGVVQTLLDAAPRFPELPELGSDDDYSRVIEWWVGALCDPEAGLHEKLVWYWHGHLTSSLDASQPLMMLRQHELLRDHALGNFRTLLQAITVDAAMLVWLDGASSTFADPNENHARELMELFALGRGNYTEEDVRAAARAMSGWWVDWETGDTGFDEANGPTEPVSLLGVDGVVSVEQVVDVVCDHPACAPHVARRMYRWFVGDDPDDTTLETLAATFRDSGLEIRPLVEAIARDPRIAGEPYLRPRSPLEWFAAAQGVLGTPLGHWVLHGLGQLPFVPPNVAGWPGGDRWISAGAVFAKTQLAWDHSWDTEVADTDDPVGAMLAKAGLHEVSDATRNALDDAASRTEGRRELATLLHALVLTCPEFSLA